MIELAIVAAGGAGLGIVAAIAIWRGWSSAADAERRAGGESVRATTAEAKLLACTLAAQRWKDTADEIAKTRDNLQDLVQSMADDLPPGGARERLHAKWFAMHNPASAVATGQPTVSVPAVADPARPSDVDLLKPGE